MKSKLISVFIATALSTIGLCSTISHASEKQFIIQATYSNVNTHSMNAVKFIKEGSNQINLLQIDTVDEMINRPLLNLYSSIAVGYIPEQEFTKKNKIFELAVIFNDKLQQILAKLSFNQSSKSKNYLINGDKPNDKHSINCSNTKH